MVVGAREHQISVRFRLVFQFLEQLLRRNLALNAPPGRNLPKNAFAGMHLCKQKRSQRKKLVGDAFWPLNLELKPLNLQDIGNSKVLKE